MTKTFCDRIRSLAQRRFYPDPTSRASMRESIDAAAVIDLSPAEIAERFLPVPMPIVEIVGELFAIAAEFGPLTVRRRQDLALVFTTDDSLVCDVPLSRPKSFLRSIGSRVGVLSAERTGKEVFLYGGADRFSYPINAGEEQFFHVSFANTVSEQWVRIAPETAG